MSIRDLKGTVEDRIPVRNVLLSVFYKMGLDELTHSLVEANDDVRFFSTGGTYTELAKLLGTNADAHLRQVSDYTGFPEMEGGLVKTLHPKIHAGLLGERNNPEHQRYLAETLNGGVYIDLVVVNLYPFEQMAAKVNSHENDPKTNKPYNFEAARGNIDIGGPCMIRAGAKNFPSCAVLCDPADYKEFLDDLRENDGCTSFNQRLRLAQKAFATTAKYDSAIAPFIAKQIAGNLPEIVGSYQFNKGE